MASSDRSISAVLQDIVANIQGIVRGEVRLAKTELREELANAKSAALLVAIGAVAAVFSALFLLLAIVYALSLVMPAWAAALAVALGIGIVAAVGVGLGIKRFKSIHAGTKTAASLKEDVQWAKQLTR